MARRKGFEPLTPRFEVWCSIQLSYRRWDTEDCAPEDGRVTSAFLVDDRFERIRERHQRVRYQADTTK